MGDRAIKAKDTERNYAEIPLRSDEAVTDNEGLLQL